jgi:hypothetical protein
LRRGATHGPPAAPAQALTVAGFLGTLVLLLLGRGGGAAAGLAGPVLCGGPGVGLPGRRPAAGLGRTAAAAPGAAAAAATAEGA